MTSEVIPAPIAAHWETLPPNPAAARFAELVGRVPAEFARIGPRDEGGIYLSDPEALLAHDNTFVAAVEAGQRGHLALLPLLCNVYFYRESRGSGDVVCAYLPARGDVAIPLTIDHENGFIDGVVAPDLATLEYLVDLEDRASKLGKKAVRAALAPLRGRIRARFGLKDFLIDIQDKLEVESDDVDDLFAPKSYDDDDDWWNVRATTYQARLQWISILLTRGSTRVLPDHEDRQMTIDGEDEQDELATIVPVGLYWMWRSYFLSDDASLRRALDAAKASQARLLADAARVLEDIVSGRRREIGGVDIPRAKAWLEDALDPYKKELALGPCRLVRRDDLLSRVVDPVPRVLPRLPECPDDGPFFWQSNPEWVTLAEPDPTTGRLLIQARQAPRRDDTADGLALIDPKTADVHWLTDFREINDPRAQYLDADHILVHTTYGLGLVRRIDRRMRLTEWSSRQAAALHVLPGGAVITAGATVELYDFDAPHLRHLGTLDLPLDALTTLDDGTVVVANRNAGVAYALEGVERVRETRPAHGELRLVPTSMPEHGPPDRVGPMRALQALTNVDIAFDTPSGHCAILRNENPAASQFVLCAGSASEGVRPVEPAVRGTLAFDRTSSDDEVFVSIHKQRIFRVDLAQGVAHMLRETSSPEWAASAGRLAIVEGADLVFYEAAAEGAKEIARVGVGAGATVLGSCLPDGRVVALQCEAAPLALLGCDDGGIFLVGALHPDVGAGLDISVVSRPFGRLRVDHAYEIQGLEGASSRAAADPARRLKGDLGVEPWKRAPITDRRN